MSQNSPLKTLGRVVVITDKWDLIFYSNQRHISRITTSQTSEISFFTAIKGILVESQRLRQHLLRQPNISTVNDIFSYIGTVSDHNSSEPYNDAYSHKQGSPKSSGGDQTMKEIANNIVTAVTESSEINIKQPQPMGSSLQFQSSSTPTHSSLEVSNSSRKHKTVKNRKVTAACNSELADESPLCGVQNKVTSFYIEILDCTLRIQYCTHCVMCKYVQPGRAKMGFALS
eukprot:CCRYP_006675-RB/>CCRYP_006675-RB protein AED:0.22 eAED:0.22 QI:161/0.6/0.5/1/0.2/0.33/6/787/228